MKKLFKSKHSITMLLIIFLSSMSMSNVAFADTAITAGALDSNVTAPVTGATPSTTQITETEYTGTVSWYESNGTTALTGNFAGNQVYIAKVSLTAETGYTLTGLTGSFTYSGATSVAYSAGVVTITFAATNTTITADALDSKVTAPVTGATPSTTAVDDTEYTGTVDWYESNGTTALTGNFASNQVYIAEVSLSAKTGFTLTGTANSFSYTGATSVAYSAGVVTITFATTAADTAITADALDSKVTAPVTGATPSTTAVDDTEYTGTVDWYESDGTTALTGNFLAETIYVAKVTLTAKTGYTLTGTADAFTYTGATASYSASVVTITFTATEAAPAPAPAQTVVSTPSTPQTVLVLTSSATSVAWGSQVKLTLTGGSGTGAVTYSSTGSTFCAVNPSGNLTPVSAGTCTVTANKDGDGTYGSAQSNSITITATDNAVASTSTSSTSNSGVAMVVGKPVGGVATVKFTVADTYAGEKVSVILATKSSTGKTLYKTLGSAKVGSTGSITFKTKVKLPVGAVLQLKSAGTVILSKSIK